MLYLIGSLRNIDIPIIAAKLRNINVCVFDDWFAAGPRADDHWQEYENAREHSFQEALAGVAAQNVFLFDKRNLDRCSSAMLVMPAGKSGHLELGYMCGPHIPRKKTYVLFDKPPERYDVMYNFADRVFLSEDEMLCYFMASDE